MTRADIEDLIGRMKAAFYAEDWLLAEELAKQLAEEFDEWRKAKEPQ